MLLGSVNFIFGQSYRSATARTRTPCVAVEGYKGCFLVINIFSVVCFLEKFLSVVMNIEIKSPIGVNENFLPLFAPEFQV